jgi:trans-aconitate 2-methyltransferase
MNESVPVRNLSRRLAREPRLRASQDLISRLPLRAPRRIADVYSGDGSMKALLTRRFPDAEIETFDLSQSGDRLAETRPDRFPRQASGGRSPSPRNRFDLIFSNGSLEMLPSLPRLLPLLIGMIAAGGCLAVQIPGDLYEPSRALLRMIAAEGPWATKLLLIAKTRPFNETMEGLYALLSPVCAAVDVWETTYLHVMTGVAAIVEWMKATRLAPFLAPLDEADRRRFLARYAAELGEAYPAEPDGAVLLRSRRLFVLAEP